jgi:quinol monooxygenase YgiN
VAFIQIIEFSTTRFDEGEKYVNAWREATEGTRTTRRSVVGRDRDDPNKYFNIAFFDSYESAMENSNLPATQQLAQQLGALSEGPPTFHNLDVVVDES